MVNKKLSEFGAVSTGDVSYFPVLDGQTKNGKLAATKAMPWTNCITDIPQNIKLSLNNGTLTLLSGSKVYVPNGAGVFDIVNITSNLSYSNTELQHGMILYYYVGLQRLVARVSNESGTSTPTAGGLAYYNINDNKIYQISGGSIADYSSFPIAKINTDSSGVTSVDQVFNGFGYVGSTVFALPGVKGLIPAGRNTDGSLKSIELNNTAVRTYTVSGTYNFSVALATSGIGAYYYAYDEKANKIYRTDTGAYYGGDRIIIGNISISSGKITSFTSKNTFNAVDYKDLENVKSDMMTLSTSQTVSAGKTITGQFTFKGGSRCVLQQTDIDVNVNPSSTKYGGAFSLRDKNLSSTGFIDTAQNSDGEIRLRICAIQTTTGGSTIYPAVEAHGTKSGAQYGTCPTPSSVTDVSQKIVTTEWINNKFKEVQAMPGSPVNGVIYLVTG